MFISSILGKYYLYYVSISLDSVYLVKFHSKTKRLVEIYLLCFGSLDFLLYNPNLIFLSSTTQSRAPFLMMHFQNLMFPNCLTVDLMYPSVIFSSLIESEHPLTVKIFLYNWFQESIRNYEHSDSLNYFILKQLFPYLPSKLCFMLFFLSFSFSSIFIEEKRLPFTTTVLWFLFSEPLSQT